MELNLFDYRLPENLIAQSPLIERDKAKLLVLDKITGEVIHDIFFDIVNYLNSNDVIVINESKVINARIFGRKETTGAKIECFVLEKKKNNDFFVLLRPSKKVKDNDRIFIDDNNKVYFTIKEKLGEGRALIIFNAMPDKVLEKYGEVPLPPYIKNRDFDNAYYQTVYARKEGSTAAPTAGLHFTNELMDKLKHKGILFAKVNLEIGLDTFKPITEKNIMEHKIHSEKYSLTEGNVKKILKAKNSGGRLISVGTTTARVLETIMSKYNHLKSSTGRTSLYIYPGYEFKIVDVLVTNFHLPKSTLIVMVSAFAGREKILKAYESAIENNYRFFSFGDCMMIK